MDKYLTIFSEQLDAAFNPETLFPDKKNDIMGWLKRKFIIIKNIKKHRKEISTVNNNSEVEYA
jgi:hypothetical protein